MTIGRFAQADSIVPLQSQGVQAWDRYAYVNNNPVRYTDPTGHKACDGDSEGPDDCRVIPATSRPRRPYFVKHPVSKDDLTWIQWFGGTETAYQDHLNYLRDPASSYNYDGYCQGFHCGLDYGADWGVSVSAGVYGKVIRTGLGVGGFYAVVSVGDYNILYQALDGNFHVSVGDTVFPDTIIAGVGNHSANPVGGNTHLHLEVRHSSTGVDDYKNRISNPLHFMDVSLYEILKSKVENSPRKNVIFYSPEKDPLKQISPIIRGGPVLWID